MHRKDYEAAREVAFRYLGYSARSVVEMRRRLERSDFPEDIIARVLEEIAALGYLNDQEFTERWIEDRADRKGYGRTRLAAELSRKGIDREQIQEAVSSISEEAEFERALLAAERKQPAERLAALDCTARQEAERRLGAFLQRRGFSYEIVRQVLRRRLENIG